jgi:F-type H+-transporting ATPase subunit a
MVSTGGILTIIHLVPLIVIFAIIGLELAIAFLQAYVFTVLLSIYLNDAISLH